MPLGTLDRTPPPFFRQGPSALTKLAVFSALAVFLMAADSRLKYTQPIRAALATVLLPIQRGLLVPVELVEGGGEYLQGLNHAIAGERDARAQLVAQAERATRVEQLAAENARLRALLDLRPALTVRNRTAEVLYEATDPYSRKVFIDRGSTQGVLPGSPVINDNGVLGQVTRVYPLSAEVTLLTDRDAAIPVLNPRTQQRSAAFGAGEGDLMELRFVAGNADVQVGDLLLTSGVDGVYPPGLAVATVVKVDRKAETGFARISLQARARPDGVRHVLVLDPLSSQMPPRPEPEVETTKPARQRGSRR
jgi:rod shape-determining protein MreC